LLNTSFNSAGEPIVETPEDAVWCLVENGLDFVVFQDRIVERDPAVRSLLDLVPHIAADRYDIAVPLIGGRLSTTLPADVTLRFHVMTPLGPQTQSVAVSLTPLLAEIDGVSNGWAIRARLAVTTEQPVEELWLARMIGQLRRERIITLRR
jgi:carbamoyltransferase